MTSPTPEPPDDLRDALASAEVLDTFQALPLEEQEKFCDWVDRARDDDSHWRRIEILVLAMRMAPPIKAPVEPLHYEHPDFWTNPMGRA